MREAHEEKEKKEDKKIKTHIKNGSASSAVKPDGNDCLTEKLLSPVGYTSFEARRPSDGIRRAVALVAAMGEARL